MNELNKPLQDPKENLLTSNYIIIVFNKNVKFWAKHIAKGNLEMFLGLKNEGRYQITSNFIESHLEEVYMKIEYYFLSHSTQVYD